MAGRERPVPPFPSRPDPAVNDRAINCRKGRKGLNAGIAARYLYSGP
jgi:hypothetical protein